MPLPAANTPWPPPQLHTSKWQEWSAWWSGDPEKLSDAYAEYSGANVRPSDRPSQHRGGVTGAVARFFWGRPAGGTNRTRSHVPLAADIARVSGGLLFGGQPPTFTAPEGSTTAVEAAVDALNSEGMISTLTEAAESASALGGVWLRAVWDTDVSDTAMLDAVDADCAWADWRWGRATAATFAETVRIDGQQVWRRLERHEPGRILHGLYRGTSTSLGKLVPFAEQPETEWLVGAVDSDGAILTELDMLTAYYVPNMRPNPGWRDKPHLRMLGRPDVGGNEPLLDNLDEAWSALPREIRLGKARAMLPGSMLRDHGPGKGQSWDEDQEYYSAISLAPNPDDPSVSNSIVLSQPDLRVDALLTACEAITRQVGRGAGLSPTTLGLADAVEVTATESNARRSDTASTVEVKRRYWSQPLREVATAMLRLDGHALTDLVGLEWPAGQPEPLKVRAETANLLMQAQSASTRERVVIVHPDWDETRVDAEVALIQEETGQSIADPAPSEQDFGGVPDPDPEDEPEDEVPA